MRLKSGYICKYKFINLYSLRNHKRNVHSYDRNYDPANLKNYVPKIEGGQSKPRGRPKKLKRGRNG